MRPNVHFPVKIVAHCWLRNIRLLICRS